MNDLAMRDTYFSAGHCEEGRGTEYEKCWLGESNVRNEIFL